MNIYRVDAGMNAPVIPWGVGEYYTWWGAMRAMKKLIKKGNKYVLVTRIVVGEEEDWYC